MKQGRNENVIENTIWYSKERVEELSNRTYTQLEWDFIKDELEEGIHSNIYEILDEMIQDWIDETIEYGEQRNWNPTYS